MTTSPCFNKANDRSKTGAHDNAYAMVDFDPLDIYTLTPEWTDEQRHSWFEQHEGLIQRTVADAGIAIISALLHATGKELDTETEIG